MLLPAALPASTDVEAILPFGSLGGARPVAVGCFLEVVLDDQAKEAGMLDRLPLSGLQLLLVVAVVTVRTVGVHIG